MAKKKKTGMKVFPYRMDEEEQAAANNACLKKYNRGLSSLIRTLVLNHFPDAKKPDIINSGKKQ